MANVKTAISIQESLFEKVEELADRLKVSRSRVFVLALEEFIRRQENRSLLERINAAYQDEPEADEKKRMCRARKSHRRIVEGKW